MSLCPGIHCILICHWSSLSLNLRGSRPVDFSSRVTHRDWESVNKKLKNFAAHLFVTKVPLPPGPSLLSRRNKLSQHLSVVFATLGEVGYPLVTTTSTPSSSKLPDTEPSVQTLKSALISMARFFAAILIVSIFLSLPDTPLKAAETETFQMPFFHSLTVKNS